MKLTKQLKEEVLKTYQASWNALLRGDIKTFASYLNDHLTVYGTVGSEMFKTKKWMYYGHVRMTCVVEQKENEKVIISAADNGINIPQKAVDKIFQPFFTTKSTGRGLELSFSYDIEGEGSEFIIQIPESL